MSKFILEKFRIHEYDISRIEDDEEFIQKILDSISRRSPYDVGDILIAFMPPFDSSDKKEPQLTSLKFNKKYIVLHIGKFGTAYAREISTNNTPVGGLIEVNHPDNTSGGTDYGLCFELDPEYVEATIMQSEHEYDPYRAHKQALKEISAVDAFNKSIRIDTSSTNSVSNLISSLKTGDTLYQAVDRYITVIRKNKTAVRLGSKKVYGAAIDHKGRSVLICESTFLRNVFYKSRPKTRKVKI